MKGASKITGFTMGSGENLVEINQASFIMDDTAEISGNTGTGNIVYMQATGGFTSSFTMKGSAKIAGNTGSQVVYINTGSSSSMADNAVFTMENGTISGNKATSSYGGGAVYIKEDGGGTFCLPFRGPLLKTAKNTYGGALGALFCGIVDRVFLSKTAAPVLKNGKKRLFRTAKRAYTNKNNELPCPEGAGYLAGVTRMAGWFCSVWKLFNSGVCCDGF